MVTLEFNVWDEATGDLVDEVTIDGWFDHSKNCYVPDPNDWHELIATFIGKNVIITAARQIVIEGLDANGQLLLLANDGAKDYDNPLLDDYLQGELYNGQSNN